MSRYQAHLNQANANLSFLGIVNRVDPHRYDWQTTVAFYSALHLVNAWLSEYGARYRSHHDVKDAINPTKGRESVVPRQVYNDYQALFRLSRRARYLLDETSVDQNNVAHTSEKHFAKAIRRLDNLLEFFKDNLEGYLPWALTVHSDRLKNSEALKIINIEAMDRLS